MLQLLNSFNPISVVFRIVAAAAIGGFISGATAPNMAVLPVFALIFWCVSVLP